MVTCDDYSTRKGLTFGTAVLRQIVVQRCGQRQVFRCHFDARKPTSASTLALWETWTPEQAELIHAVEEGPIEKNYLRALWFLVVTYATPSTYQRIRGSTEIRCSGARHVSTTRQQLPHHVYIFRSLLAHIHSPLPPNLARHKTQNSITTSIILCSSL